MFKFLCSFLIIATLASGSLEHNSYKHIFGKASRADFWEKWGPGLKEFLDLIDLEKVVVIIVKHLKDKEVQQFLNFLLGSQFKEVVWEFESLDEFKEAVEFLSSKGYDVKSVLDYINKSLGIPVQDKYVLYKPSDNNGRGVGGLLEEIIAALPLEDIKILFESKLQSSADLQELFATVNSKEFMDIMRRMAQNPKFTDIKNVFKSYGFDFKYVCQVAKQIFEDYYQGIFCE